MNKMSIQWSVAGALAFCSLGGIAEVVDGEYCYFLQDGVQVPLEYTLTGLMDYPPVSSAHW